VRAALLPVVFRKARAPLGDGRAIVTGGGELLEAERVEVGSEVFGEVAFEGSSQVTGFCQRFLGAIRG
jgi:hypothetical protein